MAKINKGKTQLLAGLSALGLAAGFILSADALAMKRPAHQLPEWRSIEITAKPHQFRGDKEPNEPIEVNGAIYRGGLVLNSNDRLFGGLSALSLQANGSNFIAASDRGQWLRGKITFDDAGRPTGVASAEMAAIMGADGKHLYGLRGDIESLAQNGDEFILGFERRDRIDAYTKGEDGIISFKERIIDLSDEPLIRNEGIEALARIDNKLIALSQTEAENGSIGYILDKDGSNEKFYYKNKQDFSVTDMTQLADGRLLVLERAYSPLRGVRMRISAVDPGAIQPGAVVEGEELIALGGVYILDNMEAIAAHKDDEGRDLLYIISDDNYDMLQKTLLLVFELKKG